MAGVNTSHSPYESTITSNKLETITTVIVTWASLTFDGQSERCIPFKERRLSVRNYVLVIDNLYRAERDTLLQICYFSSMGTHGVKIKKRSQ